MKEGLNTIFKSITSLGWRGKKERLFVNLYYSFCIASRLAELALSLTKILFSLWGPAVAYSIFASISSFALASAHIIISRRGILQFAGNHLEFLFF